MEEYPGQSLRETLNVHYGSGNIPSAVVDLRRLGEISARILLDERTINQTVFAAEIEFTLNEMWEIAAKLSKEPEALLRKQVHVSGHGPRRLEYSLTE
jgi:hypothetical protein